MDNTLAIPSPSGMEWIVTAASFIPEVLVGLTSIILLVGGVFAGSRSAGKLHFLGLLVLLATLVLSSASTLPSENQYFFSFMLVNSGFTHFIKLLLVAATALVFLISQEWVAHAGQQKIEFTVLMLLSLLGMFFMVSANDLISLYMGMELSSLALYVLAAIDRDSLKSTESGIKYFVLGALASGLFLFGASLVYGFSGTTSFTGIANMLSTQAHVSPAILVGLVLITTAFCFKVSAAPFHMWTPDVYEGAPTPVTAYFSVAPKIAAMAVLMHVLAQPFHGMQVQWQQVILVASIASMLVGAFGALGQTNIKRLLAYSSIGHVGYALVGLVTGTAAGFSAILIYFSLYLFMSTGAFACIMRMKRDGKQVEAIDDLAGLSRSHPRLAFALMLFMFSMAGIPPLAGFWGKMYIFHSALQAGFVGLAVLGVLSSVVACFYYLKVVKVMYFDEPAPVLDSLFPFASRIALLLCASVTVFFFLIPSPLVNVARAAAEALLH